MDLRLVDELSYLALGVGLTVWTGRALSRSADELLGQVLDDHALAESVGRVLVIGFHLLGLGAVALMLPIGDGATSAAGIVRSVAIRLGLALLVLGGLQLGALLALRRRCRPSVGLRAVPGDAAPARPGRFPY